LPGSNRKEYSQMTPEEQKRINDRFERIEENLDRMAEESAKAQAGLQARMAEHEARHKQIELLHAEHEARHAEHEARHAEERASLILRQQQWEARWDRIERGIQYLVDTLGKHTSDGHGSEEEEEES
jgi:hypothetical protein